MSDEYKVDKDGVIRDGFGYAKGHDIGFPMPGVRRGILGNFVTPSDDAPSTPSPSPTFGSSASAYEGGKILRDIRRREKRAKQEALIAWGRDASRYTANICTQNDSGRRSSKRSQTNRAI